MVRLVPGIEVVGGKGDNAAAVTREVGDGDCVMVGALKIGIFQIQNNIDTTNFCAICLFGI